MSNASVLALGPELTIAFAAATREQLLAAVRAQPAELALELAGVTDFDSAGVQLLLATRHSLQAQGGRLLLRSASSAVADALTTFGLHSLLADATH